MTLNPEVSAFAERLAFELERRAKEIEPRLAWTPEERAVRRSMVVVYAELAEMLRKAAMDDLLRPKR